MYLPTSLPILLLTSSSLLVIREIMLKSQLLLMTYNNPIHSTHTLTELRAGFLSIRYPKKVFSVGMRSLFFHRLSVFFLIFPSSWLVFQVSLAVGKKLLGLKLDDSPAVTQKAAFGYNRFGMWKTLKLTNSVNAISVYLKKWVIEYFAAKNQSHFAPDNRSLNLQKKAFSKKPKLSSLFSRSKIADIC